MKALAAALSIEAVARLLNLSSQASEERKVVPTRLAWRLHGTMVAQDERYSLALVERRAVRIGDRLESVTVRSISRGCVVFDNDEELCMQPRAIEPGASEPKLHAALADFARFPTVRVVPVPNGGFKLFNLPPGSIYEKLGIQNGDIVRKLNGKPVDFSLLPLVHPGARLTVELERNGQPYVLEGQLD